MAVETFGNTQRRAPDSKGVRSQLAGPTTHISFWLRACKTSDLVKLLPCLPHPNQLKSDAN